MQNEFDILLKDAQTHQDGRNKFDLLAKKLGLNATDLTDDECLIVSKAISKSYVYKQAKGKPTTIKINAKSRLILALVLIGFIFC